MDDEHFFNGGGGRIKTDCMACGKYKFFMKLLFQLFIYTGLQYKVYFSLRVIVLQSLVLYGGWISVRKLILQIRHRSQTRAITA